MNNPIKSTITSIALWAERNLRNSTMATKPPVSHESGEVVRTPQPKTSEWKAKRMERNYRRSIRRVLSRGTLRTKGRLKTGFEKPGPNKFWNRARLEREGLCKERCWTLDGKRETYLVALTGHRVLNIPNYGSIITKAA